MTRRGFVLVALSGGVDSAVTALLLRERGFDVQCLHMTNWEDDGYCEAADDFQDARAVCRLLDLPLHRANFTREYRDRVFAEFLDELAKGRTPNPDVLCNREIKFGVLREYARRLGASQLATGHYARLQQHDGAARLLKGRDRSKDQSYFLHAVDGSDFANVLFPLGELDKSEVRSIAEAAGLPVAEKRDSTGICFIGERRFSTFLNQHLPTRPGPIRSADGEVLGRHAGLACYTLGQRQGLEIGGLRDRGTQPWYVAAKNCTDNELIVVQGSDHPLLFSDLLLASRPHWIVETPRALQSGQTLRCAAKTRYRQPDQSCQVTLHDSQELLVEFDEPQRAVTPGQYVVLYDGDVCLGGATIEQTKQTKQTEQTEQTEQQQLRLTGHP